MAIAAVSASASELARCAAVNDTQARLACYERLTCTSLESEAERLRCFDRLAGRELESGVEPEVVEDPKTVLPLIAEPTVERSVEPVAPPSLVEETLSPVAPAVEERSPDDGFAKPKERDTSVETFGGAIEKPEAPKNLKEIAATVTDVKVRFHGEYLITLDNGQTWQQVEKGRLTVKVGDRVKIKRGSFGMSYWLTANDNKRSRFERIR